MANRIKYIWHPTFFENDWVRVNPNLGPGEIAFVKDPNTGITIKCKVGPGYFNDLPYFDPSNYNYPDVVTNPIGDAIGVLQGKSPAEILHLMLNPYLAPVISGAVNDAGVNGGPQINYQIKEIGVSISGNVKLGFSISNPNNLQGNTPVIVSASGIFSNEGNFPNAPVILIPAATLNPTMVQVVEIDVQALSTKGLTNIIKTYIKWVPRIIWGASALADLSSGSDVNALVGKQSLVSDNFENDYSVNAQGYHWICIPGMLSPANLVFTDVTDPNAPSTVAFISKGALVVNNGVGNYSYQLYRSPYLINVNNSTYRVRRG